MGDTLLMRRKQRMFRVPAVVWKRNVRSEARRAAARLEFMGPAHHRVRNFVVTELPRAQQPLSPEAIAAGVGLETGTGWGDPRRVGSTADLPLPEGRTQRRLGLPGNRRGDPPSGHVRQRRALLRCLRDRRGSDALRARATAGRGPQGGDRHRMRPLWASDSSRDRLQSRSSGPLGGRFAVGLHTVCRCLRADSEHHRRVLTAEPVLLVRGTRPGPQPTNPGRILDPGPKRPPDPSGPVGAVCVPAE